MTHGFFVLRLAGVCLQHLGMPWVQLCPAHEISPFHINAVTPNEKNSIYHPFLVILYDIIGLPHYPVVASESCFFTVRLLTWSDPPSTFHWTPIETEQVWGWLLLYTIYIYIYIYIILYCHIAVWWYTIYRRDYWYVLCPRLMMNMNMMNYCTQVWRCAKNLSPFWPTSWLSTSLEGSWHVLLQPLSPQFCASRNSADCYKTGTVSARSNCNNFLFVPYQKSGQTK